MDTLSRRDARTLAPQRCQIDSARTLAVTSGKGGVGKTQLSANIAALLAQSGQRVLLFDADLGQASLDLALGVQPERDLLSVLSGRYELQDIVLEARTGIHLIPACPGRYEMANLQLPERERLHEELRELAASYDTLIIDTGAGIGANSVGFAAFGSEILLVTTPEPSSLRDAFAMAKVLHRRRSVRELLVIANQVKNEAAGLAVYEQLAGVVSCSLDLKLEYLGCVPRDEAVSHAVAEGQPYVLSSPECEAARALAAVVKKLVQRGEGSELVC